MVGGGSSEAIAERHRSGPTRDRPIGIAKQIAAPLPCSAASAGWQYPATWRGQDKAADDLLGRPRGASSIQSLVKERTGTIPVPADPAERADRCDECPFDAQQLTCRRASSRALDSAHPVLADDCTAERSQHSPIPSRTAWRRTRSRCADKAPSIAGRAFRHAYFLNDLRRDLREAPMASPGPATGRIVNVAAPSVFRRDSACRSQRHRPSRAYDPARRANRAGCGSGSGADMSAAAAGQ